jgi:fructose-1,6-bisphosphatase I
MFVYTTGQGVHGFTLDPSVGEFLLSHENIIIPKKGKTYSINEGNFNFWNPQIQKYTEYIKEIDSSTNRPDSLRYIGTMVGDIHRTLLYGGIFMYPGDKKNTNGKLRLMYECNPMAFVVEQAGGKASDGYQRILDIHPTSLHQQVPIIIGSTDDVSLYEDFFRIDDKESTSTLRQRLCQFK